METTSLKPPFHPTVIKGMPFIGKTNYSDSYLGKPADYDPETDKFLSNSRNQRFK